MTYGYHRAQTVGGLVNGIALLTLCFTIFVDAIERYVEPQSKNFKFNFAFSILHLISYIRN